jgi:hypothetical protein
VLDADDGYIACGEWGVDAAAKGDGVKWPTVFAVVSAIASCAATVSVYDAVVTDGNWDARSAGALYKVEFDSEADIGPLLTGSTAKALTGQYHLPNDLKQKPTFDPVMRAMKFVIPRNVNRANAGGGQYTRFPAMSTSGNASYWFQFRRYGDYNYFNTLYRLSNGDLQLGLKQFTAGPGYTLATPFGQTSTVGKWVFTNAYGYRFPITYRQDSVGSDTARNHYQSKYPNCRYPIVGTTHDSSLPPPMPPNNPCFTGAPDRWETILINIATGPRVANPNYPGPNQVVREFYQNTRIRWWYALPGDKSYTLVDDETVNFNATMENGDRTYSLISIGQFYWEVYMTDGGIGLREPGVDANWWVKEFIVKKLPSTTAPEEAIAIPTHSRSTTSSRKP